MPSAPDTSPAIDGDRYRQAMAAAVTGVTVVTTNGPGGRYGQTVSAMCSLSTDPPSLLVCIVGRSPLLPAIEANGVFAVNVLADHQAAIAQNFAGRPSHGAPFDFGCADWDAGSEALPVLRGAAASFECRLDSLADGFTHRVIIGRVVGAAVSDQLPLAYLNRRFARPLAIVA